MHGNIPIMAAYGGGVDSTGMIIGMMEKSLIPDAILFADTGGEKPETYAFVKLFSEFLISKGIPKIITVANDGSQPTLEGSCLENKQLPSIVFGRRACSEKYKQRPQHKWAKKWPPAIECWKANQKVIKAIGYDADERHRAHIKDDDFYKYSYPMIDWGWTRLDCQEAIKKHSLPVPPKSACFFCPSSKKKEVIALSEEHPELFDRAVQMERGAKENMRVVLGLGRNWSWENIVETNRSRKPLAMLWDDPQAFSCMCQGEVLKGEGIDDDTQTQGDS